MKLRQLIVVQIKHTSLQYIVTFYEAEAINRSTDKAYFTPVHSMKLRQLIVVQIKHTSLQYILTFYDSTIVAERSGSVLFSAGSSQL